MINGLRELLEEMEAYPEVKSIIPGRINHCRGSTAITMRVQYPTRTGLKCIVRSGASVQEVFFVSSVPEALKRRIEKHTNTLR